MTRVYCITNKATLGARLVLAQNPAQAIRHVANDTLQCTIPSVQVALLMQSEGVKLEVCGTDDE
jgi:hypothetical protein